MRKTPVLHGAAKKMFIVAALILCCYPVRFILGSQPYPLLLYITAHDADDAGVVYEKINQVFIKRVITRDGVLFQLSHSVPNFKAYGIRINRQGPWRRWLEHEIHVEPGPDGIATLEIKAYNRLGGQTAVFTSSRNAQEEAAPQNRQRFPGVYTFENWNAPGIELFQRYTQPVVAGRSLTWDRALAVFAWASGFLTTGREEKNLHLKPVAILQEREQNPRSSFLCGSIATFFVAACHSVGVNGRLVHLNNTRGFGHYVAEIWSDEHQKWIVMDPMYRRVFCDGSTCFSALDIRSSYLRSLQAPPTNPSEAGYLSFYADIHYVMSNTFLSDPPLTFLNLVFGSPPVIHWRDEQTPPFEKKDGLGRLLLFYYVPRLLDAAVIPAALLVLVYLLAAARRRKTRQL